MPPQPSELWFPFVLFLVFAALSVLGAYLAVKALRGRRAAAVWAAGTAVFFAVLMALVFAMLRAAGSR
jgi:VIT1/CCC1 family predicted Fe2+/Mn2+ transporter